MGILPPRSLQPRKGGRINATSSRRQEALPKRAYQTHVFTPNTSPHTTHIPLASSTILILSPKNHTKQPTQIATKSVWLRPTLPVWVTPPPPVWLTPMQKLKVRTFWPIWSNLSRPQEARLSPPFHIHYERPPIPTPSSHSSHSLQQRLTESTNDACVYHFVHRTRLWKSKGYVIGPYSHKEQKSKNDFEPHSQWCPFAASPVKSAWGKL